MLGTGANGSCIAADLIEAGYDVDLIDQWPAHVEAMRANGLRIEMPDGDVQVAVRAHHLCDVCTFAEPFDIVLLVMKAYDTAWACHLIEPYLKPDGLLVGCQNGMTAETIAGIAGISRTLGCVIEVGSELTVPGIVRRTSSRANSWFGLGSLDAAAAGREDEVAALLRHVAAVSVVEDVLSAKWMKLTLNVMNLAPSAMLGLPMDQAAAVPGMRDLAFRLGAEAVLAGQHLGHRIVPIMGLTPQQVANTNRLPEVLFDKINTLIAPGARDTMLMDHTKGRKTEAEAINGRVVEVLEARGIAAPCNAAIAAITDQITRGERRPDIANFEAALAMIDGKV